MTREQMWAAVQNCDAAFDGVFFYAVKTTGIFCRPSCRSKLPNADNVCFFQTAAQAQAAGFRPCKRCRSDLAEYRPLHTLAVRIRSCIDENAFDAAFVVDPAAFGLSARRMTDIFKEEFGVTPKEYLDSRRVGEAARLLAQTDEKIVDIAFSSGFASLNSFNRTFKKQTGLPPRDYRNRHRANTY